MSYMRFYFRYMLKGTTDRNVLATDGSSGVTDVSGPVRRWDLANFAFYPVRQVIGAKEPGPESVKQRIDEDVD